MIEGNIEGVRQSQLQLLEKLYEIKVPKYLLCTEERLNTLVQVTDYINREVSVAIDRKGNVVAIAIGDSSTVEVPFINISERKLSGIEKKSKCFSVDELYVLPQYRNKGIGKKLLDSLIEEIKQRADYITLTTSTKDYKKVLGFYCDKNQMDFHDAFLFKKIEK